MLFRRAFGTEPGKSNQGHMPADVYTSERGVFFKNGGVTIHITEARLGEGKFVWIG
jgi:hypothetical protein